MTMLKHPDDPRKEPAKARAQRRWKNHAVEKAFKEERAQADGAAKQPKPLEPADVLEQERVVKEETTKFESKFIKEMRAMFNERKGRNLALYFLSIKAQRYRLLKEKLRRLEVREAQRVAHQKRDLFT